LPIGIINTNALNEVDKNKSLNQCIQYLDNTSSISNENNGRIIEVGH
jgi:hypothetical protein